MYEDALTIGETWRACVDQRDSALSPLGNQPPTVAFPQNPLLVLSFGLFLLGASGGSPARMQWPADDKAAATIMWLVGEFVRCGAAQACLARSARLSLYPAWVRETLFGGRAA